MTKGKAQSSAKKVSKSASNVMTSKQKASKKEASNLVSLKPKSRSKTSSQAVTKKKESKVAPKTIPSQAQKEALDIHQNPQSSKSKPSKKVKKNSQKAVANHSPASLEESVQQVSPAHQGDPAHFSILTPAGRNASVPSVQDDPVVSGDVQPRSSSDTDYYQKWLAYRKKYGNLEAKVYSITEQFSERSPIQHPQWGWGFILKIENDRLYVLFSSGMRILISNYRYKIE